MIQAILVGVGGPVETAFVGYRPNSCTLTIFESDGTPVIPGSVCTVDPVNTTISVAALAGDTTVTITSATSVTTRRRYLLGDEEVTVRSVLGLVATLCAPLERAHVIATPFQGLRVSFQVTAGTASTEMLDLRAVFVPDTGVPQAEACEFAMNVVPSQLISEIDIRKVIPKDRLALATELDLATALADARDNLVIDMGGSQRAHARLGVDHLRRLCAHRFWLDRELEFGTDWGVPMARIQQKYDRMLHMIASQAPVVSAGGTAIAGPKDAAFPDFDLGAC